MGASRFALSSPLCPCLPSSPTSSPLEQWGCLGSGDGFSGYHFAKTFSNEAGLTSEKHTRNTCV